MYRLFHRAVVFFVIASFIFSPVRVYALPTDGVIVEGAGTINAAVGNDLAIDQTSSKMVADWGSFSIASPESVTFNQPDASSIALNRVTGESASEIFGRLSANGRVFLVNPNGILFGADSQVDTAGLLASTLNISNSDFMAGAYNFSGSGGSVINEGALNSPGGFVALLGSHIENSGAIMAELGTIALASGNAITVGLDSQSTISVVVNEATDSNTAEASSAIDNTIDGRISANGGKVLLTAQVLDGLFTNAINNDGIIEANTLIENDGETTLESDGSVTIEANGDVHTTGTIEATDIMVDVYGGNLVVDGGVIKAEDPNDGSATVDLTAAEIFLLGGADVSAIVNGSGDAAVYMQATDGSIDIDACSIMAETREGSAQVLLDACGCFYNEEEGYSGGEVNVIDSEITAIVHNGLLGEESEDIYGFGAATVGLNNELCDEDYCGSVTIDNSDVTAQVDDYGEAYVNVSRPNIESHVDIINGSSVLASVGYDDGDTAAINVYAETINIDNSTLDALTTNPDYYGHASIYMQAYDNNSDNTGGSITVQGNSRVKAQTAGNGSATVDLQSYRYNGETGQYEGSIDVLNSSILSSVGSGSSYLRLYADDINVVGSTLKSTVRDNVDGGYAYLYLYPYNYYYNQDNQISIDSSVLEASTVGRGTAHIDIGRNDGYYYNYGNGSIDITNGSSLLSSVGGGDSRIWAWANDIYVANSSLKALSTAGLDAAYSNAYIYLYAYNYDYYNYYSNQNTSLTLDNVLLNADVAGLGQSYIQLYSYNYDYYGYSSGGDSYMDILGSTLLSNVGAGYAYNYAFSSGPLNITDSSVTSRSLAQDTTAGTEGSSYNNYAQNYFYSYDYNYYSSDDTDNNLTVTNTDFLAEVLGDGYAQNYLYTYDYYNSSGSSNSSLFLNNSSVQSYVVGTGSAYTYLQAYDYYSGNNSVVQLTDTLVDAVVGAGDGYSRVYVYGDNIDLVNSGIIALNLGTGMSEAYLYARTGSISINDVPNDDFSLIMSSWVNLNAQDNIGALDSPVNIVADNLSANSFGSPVWVSDESEEGGYYQYGTGNIFVNSIGPDLLNVGSNSYDGEEEDYYGGVVRSSNGAVMILTQGDMVVHNVIAPYGSVVLGSENGSIYAGQSTSEDGANVIAGSYSYITTPNGTIGVGNPGDEFNGISGQITGVVDPGETAVTGVNPAPALDRRFGDPAGYVYYQGPDVVQEVPEGEPVEVSAPIQSIWPTPGTLDEMNNPLKVNIQIIEGVPSLINGFIPTSALTLQMGHNRTSVDPALLVQPLEGDGGHYYETLRGYQLYAFEPLIPTGFYGYHPLSEADMGGVGEFGLDADAYEFIDGNLNYNGDPDPYKKKKAIM